MAVVDIHAHIYPGKIATKAAAAVGDFYLVPMFGDGMGESMLNLEQESHSPITHHVVHSVATSAKQVETINNFIAQECTAHPEFIGFATMHQDYADPEAEINRCIGLGLAGIKLHPDIQRVNLDDPALMAVYEIAQAKGLPLIIHTGDYRYDFSHPRRLVHVLRTFPDLVVDAAHFGGWSIFDLALEFLEHERCFVDSSSALSFLGPRRAHELVEAYGTKRVMFGSDFPMWSPVKEYQMFTSLGFDQDEYADMLWHNAERFLGREIS